MPHLVATISYSYVLLLTKSHISILLSNAHVPVVEPWHATKVKLVLNQIFCWLI